MHCHYFHFSFLVNVSLWQSKEGCKGTRFCPLQVPLTLNWLNLTIMQENTEERKMKEERKKNCSMGAKDDLPPTATQQIVRAEKKKIKIQIFTFSNRVYTLFYFSHPFARQLPPTFVIKTRRVSTFGKYRTNNATKRFIHGLKGGGLRMTNSKQDIGSACPFPHTHLDPCLLPFAFS